MFHIICMCVLSIVYCYCCTALNIYTICLLFVCLYMCAHFPPRLSASSPFLPSHQMEELQRRHMLLKQQIVGVDSSTGDNAGEGGAAGRKLQGRAANTVRVPLQFRYQMTRLTETAAVVRNWEDQLLRGAIMPPALVAPDAKAEPGQNSILKARIFCSRAHAYPTAVFSVMPYDAGKERAKQDKLRAEDTRGHEAFTLPKRDWRGLSYKPLFKAISDDYIYEPGYMHEPDALDDPDSLHGEHHHVAQRSATTGPILSSVILYINEQEWKEHSNEQFRDEHPQLPPSLTLSKIRNVKKQALSACISMDIEVSSVALAVICFERLILKGIVTKLNRRLAMATCLLLAVKFNEHQLVENMDNPAKTGLAEQNHIESILRFADRTWSITKKQVLDAEFGCFVHLGFSLHVPTPHLYAVFTQLLKLVNRTPHTYIDSDVMETHTDDVYFVDYAKAEVKQKRRDAEIRAEEEADRAAAEEAAAAAAEAVETAINSNSSDGNININIRKTRERQYSTTSSASDNPVNITPVGSPSPAKPEKRRTRSGSKVGIPRS